MTDGNRSAGPLIRRIEFRLDLKPPAVVLNAGEVTLTIEKKPQSDPDSPHAHGYKRTDKGARVAFTIGRLRVLVALAVVRARAGQLEPGPPVWATLQDVAELLGRPGDRAVGEYFDDFDFRPKIERSACLVDLQPGASVRPGPWCLRPEAEIALSSADAIEWLRTPEAGRAPASGGGSASHDVDAVSAGSPASDGGSPPPVDPAHVPAEPSSGPVSVARMASRSEPSGQEQSRVPRPPAKRRLMGLFVAGVAAVIALVAAIIWVGTEPGERGAAMAGAAPVASRDGSTSDTRRTGGVIGSCPATVAQLDGEQLRTLDNALRDINALGGEERSACAREILRDYSDHTNVVLGVLAMSRSDTLSDTDRDLMFEAVLSIGWPTVQRCAIEFLSPLYATLGTAATAAQLDHGGADGIGPSHYRRLDEVDSWFARLPAPPPRDADLVGQGFLERTNFYRQMVSWSWLHACSTDSAGQRAVGAVTAETFLDWGAAYLGVSALTVAGGDECTSALGGYGRCSTPALPAPDGAPRSCPGNYECMELTSSEHRRDTVCVRPVSAVP